MVKVNLRVDNSDDKADGSIDLNGATLADLSIADRMLRRYVTQMEKEMDKILDKDTKGELKERSNDY